MRTQGGGNAALTENGWNGKNLTPAITGHSQEGPAEEGPRGNGSTPLQPGPNREDALLAKGTGCGPSPSLRVIMVLGPS